MAVATYSTGTVSVAGSATVIVGVGTIWSGVNARPGDDIVIAGHTVIVKDVTDETHLVIDAWPYSSVTAGSAYEIIQRSPLRFAGGQAMADVSTLVAALNKEGFIFFVGPTEVAPDPSLGEDGQYAEQPSSGKRWLKTGGVWVYQGITTAIFTRYDLASFDTDRPASGELIAKIYPPGVTFRAGMTDSAAGSEVAATSSAVFSITKNGVQFATLTFGASSAVGVFACASDTAFTTGDVLRIIAPNPRDATLSGVAATLIGYR